MATKSAANRVGHRTPLRAVFCLEHRSSLRCPLHTSQAHRGRIRRGQHPCDARRLIGSFPPIHNRGLGAATQPKTRSPQQNVDFVKETIQAVFPSEMPVLVGASIGGNIALRYATCFPVKGLLLIAPGRALGSDLVQFYDDFKFPTTIIWGTKDTIVGSEDMRTLADRLPKAKLIMYDGAGHSAYKDQPDRFKHDLLELYAKSE